MATGDKRILAEFDGLTFYVLGNVSMVYVETASGSVLKLVNSNATPGVIVGTIGQASDCQMTGRTGYGGELIGFRVFPKDEK